MEVLFKDAWLLVLNKPSGLLAVPGRGADKQDCLARRAQQRWPEALVVHRLDRDTSGVMVLARSAEVHRALGWQFEQRQVEKRYLAVVVGSPAGDAGEIALPLRKDFERPPKHCVDCEHGRPAQTRWRVLVRQPDRARLELQPITGRSHQLRVHLAAIGHPILGDPLYAPPEVVAMAERLQLHARRLSLTHPMTGERLTWSAACPF